MSDYKIADIIEESPIETAITFNAIMDNETTETVTFSAETLNFLFSRYFGERYFLTREDTLEEAAADFLSTFNRYVTLTRNEWEHIIGGMIAKYSPIFNYDRNTSMTVEHTGDDTVRYNGTETDTLTKTGSEKDSMEKTGTETDSMEKTGSETDSMEKTGSETDSMEKTGSESDAYSETGKYTDKTTRDITGFESESYVNESRETMEHDGGTDQYGTTTTTTFTNRKDETKKTFTNRKDETKKTFTNRKDETKKTFTNRKDETTKTFTDRTDTNAKTFTERNDKTEYNSTDETTGREYGNIGVQTSADIVGGVIKLYGFQWQVEYVRDFLKVNSYY